MEVLAAQLAARPGLYLAFFSSYDYLDQVLTHLRQHHPDMLQSAAQFEFLYAACTVWLHRSGACLFEDDEGEDGGESGGDGGGGGSDESDGSDS